MTFRVLFQDGCCSLGCSAAVIWYYFFGMNPFLWNWLKDNINGDIVLKPYCTDKTSYMIFYLEKKRKFCINGAGWTGFRPPVLETSLPFALCEARRFQDTGEVVCWLRVKFYVYKMALILDLAANLNPLDCRFSALVLLLRLIMLEHFTSLVSGDWKRPKIIRAAINNRIGLSVVNCLHR